MSFRELLDSFKSVRALVVGDLMLDEYVFGKVTRISPEAPVMVVRHRYTTRLPGGAANVARNLLALGAETHVVGVAGCDPEADMLETSLREQGLTHVGIVRDPERSTTRKTRVLADHTQQVLRIDHEVDTLVGESVEDELMAAVERRIAHCDVVVLSDYLKGALTPRVAMHIMSGAKAVGAKVAVNPKPRSLDQYKGADLISLNRSEAAEALRIPSLADEDALRAAEQLRHSLGAASLLVTLGESGMAAVGEGQFFVQAPKVEVYDTAGAGDTVVATAALGFAVQGFGKEVFELAARTAACVVRHVGVATPSADDLQALRFG